MGLRATPGGHRTDPPFQACYAAETDGSALGFAHRRVTEQNELDRVRARHQRQLAVRITLIPFLLPQLLLAAADHSVSCRPT